MPPWVVSLSELPRFNLVPSRSDFKVGPLIAGLNKTHSEGAPPFCELRRSLCLSDEIDAGLIEQVGVA